MAQEIGFIGTGAMGLPMAMNLLEAGFSLRVYNRTASKLDPLIARGAAAVASPADCAIPGGIVMSMVADDRALEEIVVGNGKDSIADRLRPGGVHVSASTVAPATTERLAAYHHARGSDMLAAPVFGRPPQARARQLWICLSGTPRAKERVATVLQAVGRGTFDFGERTGAANVAKLAGNFLLVSAIEAIAEAMAMVEKAGVDREHTAGMLTQTLFACPAYQNYGRAIARKDHSEIGFRMALGLKDVELMLATAGALRAPMPLASLLRDRLLAGLAKGRADFDWSALGLGVLEDAGLPISGRNPADGERN